MKKKFFPSLLFFFLVFTGYALAEARSDFLAGHERLKEGNLKEALYFLRNAAADNSFILKDYVQYEMGEVYVKADNYPAAAEEYRKINKESAIYPEALFGAARSLELAEDLKSAAQKYDLFFKSFSEDDKAPEAGYKLAQIYEKLKRPEAAYRVYNQVDLYFPLSPYAKKSRVMEKKLARTHRFPIFTVKPKDLFKKGLASFKAGNYDEAEAIFFRLAQKYPKSKYAGEAFLMMGRAEFSGGKLAQAISSFEKSLGYAEKKRQAKNLYYLGRSYGRRGIYDKAMVYMKKALDLYPGSAYADDACYYLGVYYEYSDSPKAAISTYLHLVEIYPQSPFVDNALFRAGILSYKDYDFEEAYRIFSLSKIKNVGEETPKCLLWWGKLAERFGRLDDAAGIYYFLTERFDHNYAAYRAREKLSLLGYAAPAENKTSEGNSNPAVLSVEKDEDEDSEIIALIGERLEKSDNQNVSEELERYKALVEIGLTEYAILEGRKILASEGVSGQESAQVTMGKILNKAGEFRTPIRICEGKVKDAVLAGKPDAVPKEIWELAFPLGFWEEVLKFSNKNKLDPYLTLAVIREESRFNPKALSRSRAHGLMQIIPSTGRLLAKQVGISPFKRSKMYEVETNLMMGTYYLRNLIGRFNGNVALALAGYNGGPVRVRKWVNNWYNGDMKSLDIDEFIEYIPLRETRNYVQKVLGSYYEYKRLYGGRS